MEREQRRIEKIADFFQILSTPSRIQILLLLLEREKSVTELSVEMNVTQSSISHQRNLLKKYHLVSCRREGRMIVYQICDKTIEPMLQDIKEYIKRDEI